MGGVTIIAAFHLLPSLFSQILVRPVVHYRQEWDKESWQDLVAQQPSVLLSDSVEFTNGVSVRASRSLVSTVMTFFSMVTVQVYLVSLN